MFSLFLYAYVFLKSFIPIATFLTHLDSTVVIMMFSDPRHIPQQTFFLNVQFNIKAIQLANEPQVLIRLLKRYLKSTDHFLCL